MITIRKPLRFSEIGKKDNQEDYLYPENASESTRVFLLCDGMGGHDKGEVASRTAAEALYGFLSQIMYKDTYHFNIALDIAYDALDKIDTNSNRKPGTTMTCLCLNDDSYLVAHIGDSRIYHIRPSLYNPKTQRGGILYQSSDHSLVNDLLKAGELTEEEAKEFPQKNVITRAMQPHLAKRYKADIYQFNDIARGDYFFMCCDGILEQLSNEQLCAILADPSLDDKAKLAAIKAICDGKTRDNYSCWLIPIDNVEINERGFSSFTIQAEMENKDEYLDQPADSTSKPPIDSIKHPIGWLQRPKPRKKMAPEKALNDKSKDTEDEGQAKKNELTIRIPIPSLKKFSWKKVLLFIIVLLTIAAIIVSFNYMQHTDSHTSKIKQHSTIVTKPAKNPITSEDTADDSVRSKNENFIKGYYSENTSAEIIDNVYVMNFIQEPEDFIPYELYKNEMRDFLVQFLGDPIFAPRLPVYIRQNMPVKMIFKNRITGRTIEYLFTVDELKQIQSK